MKRPKLEDIIQGEIYTLTMSLMKDIPRIKHTTIKTVWMLGLNLTAKQVVELHPDKPTLTTVYKISSRFKDTIELLKRESHQLYVKAGLLIE